MGGRAARRFAGDIEGHAALTPLSGLENLYALGPAEGLKGEISMFD
jgi:hypothetical protein